MTRHTRGGMPPARTFNKYPVSPNADGRGASPVERRKPHDKDPLAVETGKPSTQPRHEKEQHT